MLAILETLCAMAVYGFVALRFGTLHLTIAACVAPFLLLRTPESTELAVRWWSMLFTEHPRDSRGYKVRMALGGVGLFGPIFLFGAVFDGSEAERAFEALPEALQMLGGPGLFVLVFIALPTVVVLLVPATVLRVAATIAQTVRAPRAALRSIPTNWWRIAGCTDIVLLPEIIPDADAYVSVLPKTALLVPTDAARYLSREFAEQHERKLRRAEHEWLGMRERRSSVLARIEGRPWLVRGILHVFGAFFASSAWLNLAGERYGSRALLWLMQLSFRFCIVLLCIPSWLYRWSVKGTSWILAPLLWLAHDAPGASHRRVAESLAMQKLYGLSCGVLVLGFGRAASVYGGLELGLLGPYRDVVALQDLHGIVPTFFPSGHIPLWQWLIGGCAFITLCLVHYADSRKGTPSTPTQDPILEGGLLLLGILAVSSMFVLLEMSASLARVTLAAAT